MSYDPLILNHDTGLSDWVSVDCALPAERQDVLCYCEPEDKTPYMIQLRHRKTDGGPVWIDDRDGYMHPVTHWRPLPEPPFRFNR